MLKRAVVQSLSDRAERIVNTKENLESERTHLNKVLVSNGYPESFINQATSRRVQDDSSKHETMVVIPYVRGLSEELRRICGDYSIRVVFRSGPTLRSELMRVKDRIPVGKRSSVVYQIPCSCGMVYIGETVRRLESRVKEHQDACQPEKSAIAEHAWGMHHPIVWENAKILDSANNQYTLRVKEALHICQTPQDAHFNRDVGVELAGCWSAKLHHHSITTPRHLVTHCIFTFEILIFILIPDEGYSCS